MSWQGYVDNLVGQRTHVSQAAFIGQDGSIWAKSSDLNLSPQEAVALAQAFKNPQAAFGTGFTIGEEKHMTIQADDSHIIGKKGTSGFSAYKTKMAIVFGYYKEPLNAGNCDSAVFKYAEYLAQNGY